MTLLSMLREESGDEPTTQTREAEKRGEREQMRSMKDGQKEKEWIKTWGLCRVKDKAK